MKTFALGSTESCTMTIIFLHEGEDDDNGDDDDNDNEDKVASDGEAIDYLDSIAYDIDDGEAFDDVKDV